MALDTYAGLQAAILLWLARPGDQLLVPAVPDMIRLFEAEAARRLKLAPAETIASLPTAETDWVLLPQDCRQVRSATIGGCPLSYAPPDQLNKPRQGVSSHYTIISRTLFLSPAPAAGDVVDLVYQSGLPPLSDPDSSNWLLDEAPDAYLFGSLVEAEAFIGEDERATAWFARREAAFDSLEMADRKLRWPGGLTIRASGLQTGPR